MRAVSAPTVVIIAAGEGTRMRSALPKVLHPLCGRPLILWPVAAARAAGADGFIEDLPRGYETAVGEGGLPLSSGQRQQLALARAFLRDAPLLLLDEPAAHLDADTAAQLDAALARLAAGRTVIRVAHDRHAAHAPTAHASTTPAPTAHAPTVRKFILDHGRLSKMPRDPGRSSTQLAATVAS